MELQCRVSTDNRFTDMDSIIDVTIKSHMCLNSDGSWIEWIDGTHVELYNHDKKLRN